MIENQIYVANAGDSRSALSRNGKIIELSKDHKPDEPEEEKRITAAGAKIEKGRINGHLNLSRCLGDYHYKRNENFQWDQQILSARP
jgi:serine/threonine protein phosphatase PrpC